MALPIPYLDNQAGHIGAAHGQQPRSSRGCPQIDNRTAPRAPGFRHGWARRGSWTTPTAPGAAIRNAWIVAPKHR